jgi:hypothetical protein
MNAMRVARTILAIVVVVLGVQVFAVAPRGAVAQTTPGQEPGIVAAGFGRASGPAVSAEVQIIVSRDFYGTMVVEEFPVEEEEVTGSPVAGEGETPPMEGGPVGPPALTEEDLAPIVDAIVAAGVPSDQIQVISPAFSSMFTGWGGPGGAQLRFEVPNPTLDGLTALVLAVNDAAVAQGITVQHTGVHYVGGDCEALVQEARVAAVADARARAEGLADALGVALGDLTQAADNLYYGPYGGISGTGGCGPSTPEDFGPYGPGMLAAFDPTVPAEAVAYAQVTLTFALGASA